MWSPGPGGGFSTADLLWASPSVLVNSIRVAVSAGLRAIQRLRLGIGETTKESSPFAGDVGSAEFGEPREELVPSEHRQAGRLLDDGHQDPVVMEGKDRAGPVFGVAAQPSTTAKRLAERGGGLMRFPPESLDESLESVPGEPNRAVVVLSRGDHGIA